MLRFTSNQLIKISFILLSVLCLSSIVNTTIALSLGIVFSILFGNPFESKVQKFIPFILQISIVGLGMGIGLKEALSAGKEGFFISIFSIISVLVFGYFLGKILHLDRILSFLISIGTAICGGSAIATISPIIKPDTKQVSLALAIVFTLNSVALFLFPAIGHWLKMSEAQFGLWCAIGIHDTSSVVGAASKFGPESLKIATTVKLVRALWIVPISFICLLFKDKHSGKVKIPWFIGIFILMILLNTYLDVPKIVKNSVLQLAKSGLNLTLFFIGSLLTWTSLKSIGTKSLLFSVILWLFIGSVSLVYILF